MKDKGKVEGMAIDPPNEPDSGAIAQVEGKACDAAELGEEGEVTRYAPSLDRWGRRVGGVGIEQGGYFPYNISAKPTLGEDEVQEREKIARKKVSNSFDNSSYSDSNSSSINGS